LRNHFLLLLLLFSFAGCVSQKTITGSKKLSREVLSSDLNKNQFLGIKIIQAQNGESILEYNSGKYFTPASVTKILTFYVADQIIRDSIPTLIYCHTDDTLYIRGLGDPTFLHPDFGTQNAFDFLQLSGKVIALESSEMEDEKYGPGWAWDDYPYYFQPEKSSFPIYGNCLWIGKDSMENEIRIIPKSLDLTWNQSIDYLKKPKASRIQNANHFEYLFSELPIEIDETVPFIVSDSLMLDLLKDTLNNEVVNGYFPMLCSQNIICNYPKDSVFKKLLVDSDNFIAEQLILSSSHQTFGLFDSEKMMDFALEEYFPVWQNKIKWRDGSGLSRYNMATPEFYALLLKKIYDENDWTRITDLFPDGGSEGTLKNFLFNDRPFVIAKSGSMTGVYNLCGYLLTDSGNTLIFSIMNNNFNKPVREVKREVEKLLFYLKSEY